MGKIRTKIIGLEEVEKEQAEKAKARREGKILRRVSLDKALDKQGKKDQAEEVTEEVESKGKATKQKKETVGAADLLPGQQPETKKVLRQGFDGELSRTAQDEKLKKESKTPKKTHGKKYLASKKMVDEKKKYSVKEAIELIKKMKYAGFDESVEVHLNVTADNLKGEVVLPAGTGKQVKVVIADDDVIAKIEAGIIDFDVLIATPLAMPKLVKFAKVLGPKGLMPNPKAGTVSDKPEEAIKKFQGGAIRYKTEAKFPLIHQTVGKMSFKDEDLTNNIETLLKAVGAKNIQAAFVTGSMTPSVQIVAE